ncbi:MAG: MerR family transcriptional regulator [Candidatus Omnitrophica bacterium]|nr:MerR family transcriptional regulator [Candidatus Omnitrophota bacterium]
MNKKMVVHKNDKFEEMQIDPDVPLYTSSVVCRLLDVPIWVLKQLDNEGIVSPPRKKQGNARLYSKRELKSLKHAWFYMKEHHVNVDGLKVILKMELDNSKQQKE